MAAAQHTQEVFFKVRRLCSTSSLHPTYFNVQMSQNHKTRDSHGYIPQMTSFQNTFHELNGLLTSPLKKKKKKKFRNLTFPYLEPVCCSMSGSNCCFLTCIQISQEAGQVVWYFHLLKNFPQFIVIHTVKVSLYIYTKMITLY